MNTCMAASAVRCNLQLLHWTWDPQMTDGSFDDHDILTIHFTYLYFHPVCGWCFGEVCTYVPDARYNVSYRSTSFPFCYVVFILCYVVLQHSYQQLVKYGGLITSLKLWRLWSSNCIYNVSFTHKWLPKVKFQFVIRLSDSSLLRNTPNS